MEVNTSIPAWLDKTHPNYERWERAREISEERGKLVESILSNEITVKNLHILDLGSGEGGTSKIFSEKNKIISFDISKERLLRQGKNQFYKILGDSNKLPFKPSSFNIIILQDVIEHLQNKKHIIDNLYELLKKNGIIYLSTPNKLSIFNIIADPHWGVPIISLLKRDSIRKYFLNAFRKSEASRNDIAELSSLKSLLNLFEEKFAIKINTVYTIKELFNGNKGIVWSGFHLKLIVAANYFKLGKLTTQIANDKPGILNKFFTPTFYFSLKKINQKNIH